MKRGLIIVGVLIAVAVVAYFTASKWAIRHESFAFYDKSRDRLVAFDIAVRRDTEMKAEAGLLTMPVAILNHGNTVKYTEYSFLANIFAARGYLTVSIQHDLATDAPLVTQVGELYVGRLPVYQRGIANIMFAIDHLKKIEPQADFGHLTMVGHSNGGDIAMYFAKMHPEDVKKIITLDNLRVPFMTDGKFKILSFRSKDDVFKPDPGVVPDDDVCEKSNITVVNTGAQHTEMSDRGPESVKERIQSTLDKFLNDDSTLAPVDSSKLKIPMPQSTDPGPVASQSSANIR